MKRGVFFPLNLFVEKPSSEKKKRGKKEGLTWLHRRELELVRQVFLAASALLLLQMLLLLLLRGGHERGPGLFLLLEENVALARRHRGRRRRRRLEAAKAREPFLFVLVKGAPARGLLLHPGEHWRAHDRDCSWVGCAGGHGYLLKREKEGRKRGRRKKEKVKTDFMFHFLSLYTLPCFILSSSVVI